MDFYNIHFIDGLQDGQNIPQTEKRTLTILLESSTLSIYLKIKFRLIPGFGIHGHIT